MRFVALYFIFRLPLAFFIDSVLGDPKFLNHPVILLGKLISKGETFFRAKFQNEEADFSQSAKNDFLAGTCLFLSVALVSFLVPFLIIFILARSAQALSNPVLLIFACAVDLWLGYRCLACKSLIDESRAVAEQLLISIKDGRDALSKIVGRDVNPLDQNGVIKACVETVAENTTDAIISPMFFFALGGAPLCMLFKAISTMDSMIGYKNELYENFGKVAARADDVANFLCARISAFLMIFSGALLNLTIVRKTLARFQFQSDGFIFLVKNALKVYARDRNKHASPNAAHTESACAGLLGIELSGDAFYGGKLEHKPVLGDKTRECQIEDIARAQSLAQCAAILFVILATIVLFASVPFRI